MNYIKAKNWTIRNRVIICLILMMILIFQGCINQRSDKIDNWPAFGYNAQHTNFSPSRISKELQLLWKFAPEEGSFNLILDNDKLFLFTSGQPYRLYAIDANYGKILWYYHNFRLNNEKIPVATDGKIVVSQNDGIVALDQDSGKVIWRFETDLRKINSEVLRDAIVVSDNIILFSDGATIFAIKNNSGKLLWKSNIGEKDENYLSISVLGEKIFVASEFSLKVLDFKTGELLLSKKFDMFITETINISEDKILIVAGSIYCLDKVNLETLWSHELNFPFWSASVAYGNVYIIDYPSPNQVILAINLKSGEKVWEKEIGKVTKSINQPSHIMYGRRSTNITIADGKLFLGNIDGNIYSFDANNGQLLWTYNIGEEVYIEPVIAYGRLYISTLNAIYCFGEKPVVPK